MCKELALTKKAQCLSSSIKNNREPLLWRCTECFLTWENSWAQVKNKTTRLCKQCNREALAQHQRLGIEKMHALAKKHGGKCVSSEYKNYTSPLSWECKYGHIFERTYQSLKHQGGWCTVCGGSYGEAVTREFFEKLFKEPFPRKRPSWLNGLELDGFSQNLKIAFEHQGEQHYRPTWIANNTQVLSIQKNDITKAQVCKEMNVTLFIIPQLGTYTKIGNLYTLLQSQHPSLILPPSPCLQSLNLTNPEIEYFFQRIKTKCQEFNGEPLSTIYQNSQTKIKLRCKTHAYEFNQFPSDLLRGHWGCKKCIKEKLSISSKNYYANNPHPSFRPLKERFLAKIHYQGDCWVWKGYHRPKTQQPLIRYGYQANKVPAIKVAWELNSGTYPKQRSLYNKCGNNSCVNPNHWSLTA